MDSKVRRRKMANFHPTHPIWLSQPGTLMSDQLNRFQDEILINAHRIRSLNIEARRKQNFVKYNIFLGYILGNIFTNAGRNLNDNSYTIGDAFDNVGTGLVRLSFGISRLFSLRPLDLECDFKRIENLFIQMKKSMNECQPPQIKRYKIIRNGRELEDALACLNDSNFHAKKLNEMINALTALRQNLV